MRTGEEERTLFLSLPPNIGAVPDAKGIWLAQPALLPEGTYLLSVKAEAVPPGPVWVNLAPSLPERCEPLPSDSSLLACSAPPPSGSLLVNGEAEFQVSQELLGHRFLYLGVGWVEGTSWSGTLEVAIRHEAF